MIELCDNKARTLRNGVMPIGIIIHEIYRLLHYEVMGSTQQ